MLELRCTDREAVEYLIFQHNVHRVIKTEIDVYLFHRAQYERFADLLQERLHLNYSLQQHYPEHGLNQHSLHQLLETLDLRQSLGGEPEIEVSLNRADRYRYSPMEHEAVDTDPRSPDSFPFWKQRSNLSQGLFGITDYMTIESWFYPHLYDELSGRIRPNTSPARLFHGPGWNLVLVIPLQDVPGHFCGILCIGRKGEYPQDYIIRLFPDFGHRTDDTGFILPPRAYRTICRSEENGKGHLIAYNNPLHLIRTHLQYEETPDQPLIGWIDDFESMPQYRTVNWLPFHSVRDITFWMQNHQPWTVRTAIEQDAKILLYDPFRPYPKDDERGNKDLQRFRPTWTALEKMPSDAQPWPVYLDRHFKRIPPELAVEELKQITLTPQRFETCLSQLPPSNPMRRMALRSPKPCRVTVGQYDVFEEAAGIFRKTTRQDSPVFVTDAKCFLDHVYFTARHVRKIYRGRILFEGRTISFDSPVNLFDKNPIGTVAEVIRRAGLPEPTFRCKNRFYRQLIRAMSSLKPIETIASVGWNGKTQRLEFPQFQLSKTKGVIQKPYRARFLDDNFPAKYLEPPDLDTNRSDIPIEERQTISQWLGYLTPFLSACSIPIIFPMIGMDFRPTFLSSCNIEFLKPIVEVLGIPTMPTEIGDDMKKLVKYSKQHRWPVLTTVQIEPEVNAVVRLGSPNIRNCVICMDEPELLAKVVRCNSKIVHVAMLPTNSLPEPNWQILAPLLKSLFFGRLRGHLFQSPKHESIQSFTKDECRYWAGCVISILGGSVNQ